MDCGLRDMNILIYVDDDTWEIVSECGVMFGFWEEGHCAAGITRQESSWLLTVPRYERLRNVLCDLTVLWAFICITLYQFTDKVFNIYCHREATYNALKKSKSQTVQINMMQRQILQLSKLYRLTFIPICDPL